MYIVQLQYSNDGEFIVLLIRPKYQIALETMLSIYWNLININNDDLGV